MSEHKLNLSEEVRAANREQFEQMKVVKIPAPKLYLAPKKINKKNTG